MRKCSFLIFIMISSCLSKSQDLSRIVYEFSTGENDSSEATRLIYENGKSSVPLLIGLIDIDKKGYPGFSNKFSSKVDLSTNFLGMNSAFMIELILCTNELKFPLVVYEGTNLKTPVNGISLGLIVKEGSSKPLLRDDMTKVKRIYNEWWERKKDDSLETIRKSWQSGDRPLVDSGFIWQ